MADEVFLAVDLVLLATFLAAALAFSPAFLAEDFAAEAVFAAARIFLATAMDKPAFWSSFALVFAILATVVNFAAFNFFSVAAPTPGSEVMSEDLPFPAMGSPVHERTPPILNLPAIKNGTAKRFLHVHCPPAIAYGDG